jgi:hydrogenase-4 component E
MSFDLLAWLSLAIIVCNLYMLATSRLSGMIRGVAAQGFLLSMLPLLLPNPAELFHTVLLVVLGMAIKGILIPRFLTKAIRDIRVVREVNPSIGYTLSVAYGVVTSAFAFYILRKVPFSSVAVSPLHTSIAIATAFIGVFLIVARRNVVSQIVGYLVFENSAFILAISVAAFQPLLVEMGILLDMLVGVFIMVVAVHHIHTRHRTIDVQSLERLRR